MDAIIDKFGTDVPTYACDQHSFRVITTVTVGKLFYNWILGFGGKVKIKSPETVKEKYREMVISAAENL